MKRTVLLITVVVLALAWGWLWVSQRRLGAADIVVGDTTVRVEIASSIPTQKTGLSGRASLPDGTGMLFVFSRAARHAIWMKDMRFAIDIIWIRNGVVVDIAPNVPAPTQPEQVEGLRIYQPRLEADRVLEVPAGFSAEHGLKIGDTVVVKD